MSNNPPQVDELFDEAIRRAPGEERERFLAKACGDDAELKQRVERLLRAVAEAGSFLESPAQDPSPTIDQPITEKPGTQIGPYKLLQQIGEGGMGVVYMAEQKEPVKRRVALKIIKPGMDSRQVIARFEAERQALAMMDHPNIAKVLDAGQTDSGRPYFVMELVEGVPVTQYCDGQHLNPKERLELFVPICQAVQHAHQKGIIHRDLKPSNVLVALYDGQAVPKVIDFGVAKATSQTLTEETMFTQLGQVVGTLEYMSPEQAQVNQLDVDTRSDIYSLGVLLYELLTGATPFDRERLRSAAFEEMMRIIREEEPPKPSTRLSTIDTLPSVAANRKIEPKKLSVLVRGELDWIVMKALEKDRARRYETATGFANDIQRYLNDEAVVACPPSRAYRFRKFVRRNNVAIVTTGVVVLALMVGIVGTSWQAIRATKERNRATAAEQLATERLGRAIEAEKLAQDEAEKAETEAAIAKAVNDFLREDLLAQSDPDKEPDRDIKLRTVVDRAAEKVEGRFKDQPLVEAAIRVTIGWTDQSLGEYDSARQHFTRALEIRRQLLGEEHAGTLKAMNCLAVAIAREGEHMEAEKLFRKVLEARQRVLPPQDPRTLTSMNNLAATITSQGRHAEAEVLLRQVLGIQRRVLGPEHPHTLRSMANLAKAIGCQRRWEETERLCREALEIRKRVQGPEHPSTLGSMSSLAIAINSQGRHEDAEKLYREVLEIRRKVLGLKHPTTLVDMNNLANTIRSQGRHEDAEKLYREVLEIQRVVLGPEHPDTLGSMNNLAIAITSQGRHEDAETLYREVLEIVRGVDHPLRLASMQNLAKLFAGQGRYEDAEKLYREVLEIQRKVLGPQHPATLDSMNNLANAIRSHGRHEEAETLYRDALKIWEKLTRDFPNVPTYQVRLGGDYCNLGSLLANTGHLEKALPCFASAQEALEGVLRQSPQDAVATRFLRNVHANRAQILGQLSRHDEAAHDWEQATRLSGDAGQRDRVRWSNSLARSGQWNRAVIEAAVAAQASNVTGADLYACAYVFALACAAETDGAALHEHYAARALELLHDARDKGFRSVELFQSDPDLEAFRQRPGYRRFIEELDVYSTSRTTDSQAARSSVNEKDN